MSLRLRSRLAPERHCLTTCPLRIPGLPAASLSDAMARKSPRLGGGDTSLVDTSAEVTLVFQAWFRENSNLWSREFNRGIESTYLYYDLREYIGSHPFDDLVPGETKFAGELAVLRSVICPNDDAVCVHHREPRSLRIACLLAPCRPAIPTPPYSLRPSTFSVPSCRGVTR